MLENSFEVKLILVSQRGVALEERRVFRAVFNPLGTTRLLFLTFLLGILI